MNERTLCLASVLLVACLWCRALWFEHQARQPVDNQRIHLNRFEPCEEPDVAVGIFRSMYADEPFTIPLLNHREASPIIFKQLAGLRARHLFHANLTSPNLIVPGGITDRTTGAKGVYLILHMSAPIGGDDIWVEYAKSDGSDGRVHFQRGIVHRVEGHWELHPDPVPIIE